MTQIKIITVATESKYYLPYLKDTVKKNGGELIILGYGEEWKGFSWRQRLIVDYLKSLKQSDIVCFVDGYDVICLRNLNELKNEFLRLKQKHKCKIVVGNEYYEYNLHKKFRESQFGLCKNEGLNAGFYIGYANDLLYIINSIYSQSNDDKADDQKSMVDYCNKNPNLFYIDKNFELSITYAKIPVSYTHLTLPTKRIV